MAYAQYSCHDDCETTYTSGRTGRVCDATCEDGYPYGSLGCGAKEGAYGFNCRACFNDVDDALSYDTHDHRAIMYGYTYRKE